jgi:hypothetical protein
MTVNGMTTKGMALLARAREIPVRVNTGNLENLGEVLDEVKRLPDKNGQIEVLMTILKQAGTFSVI